MNTAQAEQRILESGGTWKGFMDWMTGQTYGINEDGSENWYDYDVNQFCKKLNR